jgi:hypothetical protein
MHPVLNYTIKFQRTSYIACGDIVSRCNVGIFPTNRMLTSENRKPACVLQRIESLLLFFREKRSATENLFDDNCLSTIFTI